MEKSDSQPAFWYRLWSHIKPLLLLSDNKRSPGFVVVVSMSVAVPVLVGTWLGDFSSAVIASAGALAILYMQQTNITHRMMMLVACSFGFAMSFTLGILTSFNIYLSAGTLALTVFLATILCRLFSVPPPGSFFFIMLACVSRTLPFDLTLTAERVGILFFGCMSACVMALIYSLAQLLFTDYRPAKRNVIEDRRVAAIVLESAVISLFVGGGYFIALLLKLDNPYWVPISTAAIMQGATFRAVWHRKVHRVFGTVIGMGVVWIIFSLSPNVWVLAGLIILLSFVIEMLVTRNYGLAVIFITPLTVIFADFAVAAADTNYLILTRLIDIMFGSFIGYVGGWVIHHPRFFSRLEQWMVNR